MHNKAFPKGFLWGTATSAYQVEGGIENDWSVWEQVNAKRLASLGDSYWQPWQVKKFPGIAEPANYISGQAADHYHRYEADFDIAKELGQNAFRLSFEWARIQPERGHFVETEIEHYRAVIRALKARGLEPFVTLWHWTNPLWVAAQGGWENKQTVADFLVYVRTMVAALKDEGVTFWMPLNEPGTYIGMSYIQGAHPPQKRLALRAANKAFKNLMKAYREAYKIIHEHIPEAQVGMSHYAVHMVPYKGRFINKLLVAVLDYIRNWRFLNSVNSHNDFIGIQYYHTDYITWCWGGGRWGVIDVRNPSTWQTDLGWLIHPEGIYPLLMRAAKYGKPIYITENGLADRDDVMREQFIKMHLTQVHHAIQQGAPVKGYFYWSLLDNFEWDKGYWPRFGLVEVNYKTFERKIRPSAHVYKEICIHNAIVE